MNITVLCDEMEEIMYLQLENVKKVMAKRGVMWRY